MSQDQNQPHALKLEQLLPTTALHMFVHPEGDQHVSAGIASDGIWEPYESELFCQRLREGDGVLDVGANLGYYSLLAAAIVGDQGRVVCFEPDAENFSLLEKNLSYNDLEFVEAVNAGLAATDGEAQLFLNDSNYGDHQIYDDGSGRRQTSITLRNGSRYLHNIFTSQRPLRLVKIDTQGAECQVLQGLLPLLLQQRKDNPEQPLSLIVEFWPLGLKRAGGSADELLDLLIQLELPISIIDHVGHQLAPCSEQQLREWVAMVDGSPGDEGFMNILLEG